ncbi:hypothetical protein [Clostridium sp. HMP27]|uniref:hypothetical protein n=1 Tax=Clostridium sp. HMP27 TaxID=1487921 RepID=UPI00052CB440|nr:hypothetical protein [Clostridium sp. HMP27]KGK84820.1 hypothetical protein DP68_16275 [Clostridium sp. HMP27]
MKDSFAINKKIRLSIYSLPKIIYVKYSILAWFLIVLINGLSISFIYLLWNARDMIPEELLSFLIFIVFIILTIYVDTDLLHAIMKRQFIEISDKSIRVKKLTSDRSFDWSEIKSIEEMYSIKFHLLIGVKLKKRDNDKTSLLKRNITINFNKFANIEIKEFFEVLYRKKNSNFRIRF